jgi:hypothetical protein
VAAVIVRQLLIKLQTMQQEAVEPVVLLVLAVLRELQVHLALRVRPALLELAVLLALLVQVEAAVAVVQAAVVGKPSKSCSFIAFSKKYANNRRFFTAVSVLLVFEILQMRS